MLPNKLMIVAHPDDETLFGGGELLKHKGEYKVICLDYGNHIISVHTYVVRSLTFDLVVH